jgi:hypothetical protein
MARDPLPRRRRRGHRHHHHAHAPIHALDRRAAPGRRTANFPIVTHALSAPLVAIMGLSPTLQPSEGKGFRRRSFSTHGSRARLLQRTCRPAPCPHTAAPRRPPATNFRNALATTSASLEFVDPDLFLLPLGQDVDTTLEASLRVSFASSRVEVVRLPSVDGLPDWSPEPVIAATPPTAGTGRFQPHLHDSPR